MYYMLGICLAFAALFAINALASVAATMLWHVAKRPSRRWSAAARANLIFALRATPFAGSLICVAALLLPAYVALEPKSSAETVGPKLALLSLLSFSSL